MPGPLRTRPPVPARELPYRTRGQLVPKAHAYRGVSLLASTNRPETAPPPSSAYSTVSLALLAGVTEQVSPVKLYLDGIRIYGVHHDCSVAQFLAERADPNPPLRGFDAEAETAALIRNAE